jgi:hypothetical protein
MAFDGRIIEIMLEFTPEALAGEFAELYKFEHGEKKVIEIIRKVENSKKVQQYLNNILSQGIKPSAKGLETLMNTISYFMFSKEETLCLGGLSCFILWRNKWMILNNIWDVTEQQSIDEQLVTICVDLINNCSANKYNKYDNFFLRFERKIAAIAREQGL